MLRRDGLAGVVYRQPQPLLVPLQGEGDGAARPGAQMRLLRDNIVIYDGAIASLQRFKDSVKEVAQGYECGITFEKFQDIKEGDVIEAYLMEQIEV